MQLKHVILVALCVAVAYSTVACTGATGAGKVNVYSICQTCHRTCATCVNATKTGCATCALTDAVGFNATTGGACACAAPKADNAGDACKASTAAANEAACTGANMQMLADAADSNKKTCFWPAEGVKKPKASAGVTAKADAVTTSVKAKLAATCWGGLAVASDACTYTALKAWIAGSDVALTSTSAVPGYRYDATTFEWIPCAVGCKTCDATKTCLTCDATIANMAADATGVKCECAVKFFGDAATVTVCTACGANCDTCTSATVCTKCSTDFTLASGACTASTTAAATTDATTTGTIAADAPPADAGCDATNWGCTKCDSAKACTTCNADKNWMLDSAKCKCKADYVGSTTDKKDCGLKCATSCVSP